MTAPLRIAVLGAGAWGTALAVAWAGEHPVRLWSREAEQVAAMQATRCNTAFLPEVPLPDAITVYGDLDAAVRDADLAVVATPVAGLRPTLGLLKANGFSAPILWVCKGFEAGTGLLPHQVAAAVFGVATGGALTGPSFAQEVAAGMPTAVTLAIPDVVLGERLARALHTTRFRIYAHDDLIGAEVGGAVKNALAIATGICDGLKLGLNARAALMTRGLAEMSRLGEALGGRRETFLGLTGVGDLLLTCTGDLSRNRRVGLALAEGRPLDDILRTLGHVAEGVGTAREVDALSRRLGVDMPICSAVAAVLDGRLAAAAAVGALMAREPKNEFA